jgi:hypothetical protein
VVGVVTLSVLTVLVVISRLTVGQRAGAQSWLMLEA